MMFRKTLTPRCLAQFCPPLLHGAFAADDTIKVGVLHSLSGTMAISETTLKDAMLNSHRRAKQEGRRSRQEA